MKTKKTKGPLVLAQFQDEMSLDARIIDGKEEITFEVFIESFGGNYWEKVETFPRTSKGLEEALKALMKGIKNNIDNHLYDEFFEH